MALEEKSAWILGIVAIIGYGVYVSFIFAAAEGGPVETVNYVPAMLFTIGAGILVGIVLGILVGMAGPRRGTTKDARDREINSFGEHAGNSFVIAGALGALALAIVGAPHFWIANVIYLGFVPYSHPS